jgi:APA family basic amino acid/polyamine antiporter
MGLFTRKSVDELTAEAHTTQAAPHARTVQPDDTRRRRDYWAGIFVITGTAAAQFAGPALVISMLIAGVGCAFAGLCTPNSRA